MDLLHLPSIEWPSSKGLKCLLDKLIKLRCVDLDVQVRRDASIIIKIVGEEAGDENEDGLATGCGQGSAGHVADGCLYLGGFVHALRDGS